MDAIEGDSAAPLTVSAAREASTLVITLEGELDLSNVGVLNAVLGRELQDRPEEVVFDLNQLSFMDSSGIAVLLRTRQEVGAVTLRKSTDVIRRVIIGTGLADILRMEP